MGVKFRKLKLIILWKTGFIFCYEMPMLRSSEVNEAILEQLEVTE